MRGTNLIAFMGLLVAGVTHAHARPAAALTDAAGGGPIPPAVGVLQCVPYARDTSGIKLYGDAHTWWNQAQGKYARGHAPKPGAVLAIRPHGNSTLGHVATVTRVIDSRTILIEHANWSAPGKIERNVTAVDVSPENDWSKVRVWFAPIQNLGGSHWPVAGFIYNAKPGKEPAPAKLAQARVSNTRDTGGASAAFMEAFAQKRPARMTRAQTRNDPIGAIIARSR